MPVYIIDIYDFRGKIRPEEEIFEGHRVVAVRLVNTPCTII
jgi:hypothetical protein